MAVANGRSLLGKRQEWTHPQQAATVPTMRTQARQMNMQGGQQNMEHNIPESVYLRRPSSYDFPGEGPNTRSGMRKDCFFFFFLFSRLSSSYPFFVGELLCTHRLTVDDMLAIHDAVMIHFETPTMFAKQLDAIRVTG